MGVLGGALSQLGGGFAQVGSVVSGFAAGGVAGAAAAGLGQIISGLKWATGEAAKNQQAWVDLQASLKLTGPAWDTAKTSIDTFASSLQKMTVYEDEAIVGAVQKLSTFGMSYTQAMDAVKVAVDLAAAKHIDLETATELVGKAFMGNTSILTRYGIDVTTSKEASAALKDALSTLGDALTKVGEPGRQLSAALADAGIQFQIVNGHIKDTKAVAEEIVGAFQQGKISAADFSNIMGGLGVTIDATKLAASDFPSVMASLNKQFGGEAVAQAQTYVGAQERLKNAMSDLGEKIGGIVLPALAGMTEAMIPVVDWFGKGVDQVQNWITVVGKMPEVKAATDALGKAFAGLQPFFDALWDALKSELMPALQDLWASLKDLWEALQPLGEALGEIVSAFGGAGGEGIKLRDIIGILVEPIKALALIIRDVAPYIKLLGQAIKECADIIGPPLRAMVTDIGAFLTWLHDSFDTFYKWLVGGSLWSDLWSGVVDIVRNVGPALLTIVGSIFTLIGDAFTLGMGLISGILTTGFSLTFGAIQTIISTGVGIMTGIFQPFVNLLDTSKKTWSDLLASITTNTELIKGKMNEIIAKVRDVAQQMIISWTATMNAMQNLTASAFDAMVAKISEDVDKIIKRLEDARNTIATHSIWPDMLSQMVQQSEAAMANMNAAFASGLTGPRGVVTMMGNTSIPAPQAQAGPTYLSAEVPIRNEISIDGEQISTIINRNTIRQRQLQRAAFA